MFLKVLTLHSTFYVVCAGAILAAHHMVPSSPALLSFWSDVGNKTEIFSTQVVNRSLKSSKLPITQTSPHANGSDCQPHVDVRGRCFADARLNRRIA